DKVPGDFVDVLLQRGVAHLELARARSRAAAPKQPSPADSEEIATDCRAAREDATRYLALAPKGSLAAQAWYLSAVASAISGDKQDSVAALQTMAKQFAKHPEREVALLEVAGIAYAKEDYPLAESLNEELAGVSQDPVRRSQALAELGWSRSQQKKHADAVAAFRKLLTDYPDQPLAPEAGFMVGQSLAALGKKREAQQAYAAAFQQAGESDHTFQSGWRAARLLFELNEAEAADAAYVALLQRFPKNSRADRALDEWATEHYDAQRFERADELFRRLASEYTASPLAWNAKLILAESELIADRPKVARTQFLEIANAPTADKKSAERALYQLQNIAQELQDWNELKQLCDQSTQRFPEGTYRHEAELARAEADFQQQDYAAAVVRLERLRGLKTDAAVANRPWFGKVFVRLAECHLREKAYDKAQAVIAEMQEWDPQSPLLYQAYEIQGKALKNQARFADARRWFQKVIDDKHGRKTETAARSQFLLAETYLLEQNFDTALDEYLKVEIGYEYPYWQSAALYHAGTCQESLKDAAGARKTYTRLLANFPDSEFAPKAKDRLTAVRKTAATGKP
ncbi:MAG: tetratricopeptide repeat protein, partial [Planctomycetota bacterium]|nr:tetratricopeptide repeat protein [Planctomycetota bacterium]